MSKEARDRIVTACIVLREPSDVQLACETLENLNSIVEEIIVVDTCNCEDRDQLEQKFGCTLVTHSFQDSYSQAKNAALSSATGEWVLWIEPGETITPEDQNQLRSFINTQVDIMTAYVLLVRSPKTPGAISHEQIGQIRLVPNHPAIRFDGRVRETMFQSLAECGMSIDAIPYLIQRHELENNKNRKVRRASQEVRLVEIEIKEQAPSAPLMICMAEAVQTLEDSKNALLFFDQACRLADHASAEMLEAFYGILTSLDGEPNAIDTQIQTCLTALEIFPLDAQLLCAVGGYLQTKGQLELARRSFETAYKYGQINLETWHIDDIDEIAASCLAITTHQSGQQAEAEAILLKALEDCPASIRLRRQVIETHAKHGRRDEALVELEKLPAEYPKLEAYRSAVRGACLAAKSSWSTAISYLQSAYGAGCREPVCLRWYATTLAALRKLEQSREVLEQWKAADPHTAEPDELAKALFSSDEKQKVAG